MIISEETRSGKKNVDDYIQALETELKKYQGESNTKRLIRSIDGMAGNISDKLDLLNADAKNPDGTEVELSGKFIDSFIKMVDKSDKIKAFAELAESLFSETVSETTIVTETTTEKKINTSSNKFEEIQNKIKGKG